MVMRAVAPLLLALAIAPACRSSTQAPDEMSDGDLPGRDVNPDGVPYPTQNIGSRPRQGTLAGQVIPNFKFQGYPSSDSSAGLKVVSLADYYDPQAKDHKLLYLSAAASWCVNCDEASDAAVQIAAKYRALGAIFVEVLVNGRIPQYGPSLSELDAWVGKHKTAPDVTVLVDVRARRLGPTMGVTNVPWSSLIDTRSMEILSASLGSPDIVGDYVQLGLNWVNANPPSKPP
jgi:hypothetical protein